MVDIIDFNQKKKEISNREKRDLIANDIKYSEMLDKIKVSLEQCMDGLITIEEFKAIVEGFIDSIPSLPVNYSDGHTYIAPNSRQKLLDKYSSNFNQSLIKTAIIKRLPNGRYRLYSRKKDKSGKRRNLGTFDSLEDAKKREKQVQFFKYHADDQNSRDKETKALSLLSDLASYLEQAGYVERSQDIYNVMDAIDNNLDSADDMIPDVQRNVGNMGNLSNTGISSGLFGIQEAEKLASLANKFDKLGLYDEADKIDKLLKQAIDEQDLHIAQVVKSIKRDYQDGLFDKMPNYAVLPSLARRLKMNINNSQEGGFLAGLAVAMGFLEPRDAFGNPEAYQSALMIFQDPDSVEMDNLDALVRSNGLQGTTSIDGGSAGQFAGLSDAYFYTDYTNLDHRYKIAP